MEMIALLFAAMALILQGGLILICCQFLILAEEAGAEISKLKRIIAEKDAEINELGQSLEDAYGLLGDI